MPCDNHKVVVSRLRRDHLMLTNEPMAVVELKRSRKFGGERRKRLRCQSLFQSCPLVEVFENEVVGVVREGIEYSSKDLSNNGWARGRNQPWIADLRGFYCGVAGRSNLYFSLPF